MPSLIFQIVSWPALGIALLVFGFAPGAVLRLIVLAYPRDDPRRRELLGELYAVPRIERPFWVIEQLEVGLFEGLRGRFAARLAAGRKLTRLAAASSDGRGVLTLLERTAVLEALRALPARQREALVLRYYGDLSEAQIAATMGISRGAVKAHTARALAALRSALQQGQ
jgi:DNA-binding CsgD family transcriptional regulator